jgi:iron complex outermembrane receptor protein
MQTGNSAGPIGTNRNFLLALVAGASVLALSTPAGAQDAAPASVVQDPQPTDPGATGQKDIIVTGTRIQGVAPVGSELRQLSTKDIQATGLTSTADILNTIPSILQLGAGNALAGGQAQQSSTITSFTFNKSPNIRGLGVGATLSLVNGHRVPYEGGNMNAFDGDNFPPQMIQRIEVLEDGGSALYGADAIAGTVNYILRKPKNTLEIYAGYGNNKGDAQSYYVTGIGGIAWREGSDSEGGIIVSYSRSQQDPFRASKRPDLYNDDLSPYAGQPSSLYAAPGNVLIGGRYYGIPGNQDGKSLKLADLVTSPNRLNSWTNIEVIPDVSSDRFVANFEQKFGDAVRLFADGYYTRREIFIHGPNSSTSNRATNFGGLPRIPNANPFSPCNPSHYPGGIVTGPADLVGACAAGGLEVAYSTVYDIGTPTRTATTKSYTYGGGAEVKLPADWSLTGTAYFGRYMAPSVTTQTGGSPLPPVATFNYFCDPTAFQCTDSAAAAAILATGRSLIDRNRYSMQDYQVNLTGALFSLPGGDVKAAIGAEYYKGSFLVQNNFGANQLNKRRVKSVYGELYIPIIGEDMNVPAVHRLELTIAGRRDDYNDAGVTTNPKIGVNWEVTDDLKLFGSYSTSFRAPGLADNDPYSQTGVIPSAASGNQIFGTICAACQAPLYNVASIYQTLGGAADSNLRPETSKTYAFGAEWKPDSVPGFRISAKYWWVSYKGQIGAPAFNVGTVSAINRGIYNSQIIYNPALFPALAANNPQAFFGQSPTISRSNPNCAAALGKDATTQALFNAMIQCFNTGGEVGSLFGPPTDPSKVLAVVNGRRINAGTTEADGIDFTLTYRFDSGIGAWNLGAFGSFIRNWKVSPIAGAPLSDEVNSFGYPLRFRARAQAGWDKDVGFGRLSANLFANYANRYKMNLATLPAGVPASYARIGSFTTFDLSIGLDTGDDRSWLTKGLSLNFSVQNLFNTDPPLVVNQAGLAGSALRFDPTYGSPLGRIFQIQVGKRF